MYNVCGFLALPNMRWLFGDWQDPHHCATFMLFLGVGRVLVAGHMGSKRALVYIAVLWPASYLVFHLLYRHADSGFLRLVALVVVGALVVFLPVFKQRFRRE